MEEQSNILLITLIFANLIVLLLLIYVRKEISSKIQSRTLDIENENIFISKINTIKNRINSQTNTNLLKQISQSKQYLIEDAIKRSRSVSKGKIAEHFAPFMMSEIFNPDEMVFIGSPIDLISFTDIDIKDEISIDFLEIKTGNSTLNKKQKLIKDAIDNGRVYFKTVELI